MVEEKNLLSRARGTISDPRFAGQAAALAADVREALRRIEAEYDAALKTLRTQADRHEVGPGEYARKREALAASRDRAALAVKASLAVRLDELHRLAEDRTRGRHG